VDASRHGILGVALAVVLLVTTDAGAAPEKTASEFLHHVQRGDLAKAKRLLDSKGSKPQGGDDVYFTYEAGYDPTLAFLVGRPFTIGTPSVREQRSDWYLLDGTLYGSVAMPLRFDAGRYQPWVLPAPIAFGRRMDFVDFMNFVTNPAAHPQQLSLRIRPDVGPGLIKPPAPRVLAPPPPVGPPGAQVVAPRVAPSDTYGSLMGPRPVDPAPVVLPSGEALTPPQLQRLLPRLAGITLHVSLIRWGRFTSWQITRWNYANAVLATEKGEVVMGVGAAGALREQQ
jgi:hypothetical protein